jgi:hypothetical protein
MIGLMKIHRSLLNCFLTIFLSIISSLSFASPPGEVEIIDAGDTETMKALFPGLDDEALLVFKKMRDKRLSYEALCTPMPGHRSISILFSGETTSPEMASNAAKVAEEKIALNLKKLSFNILKDYSMTKDIYDHMADEGKGYHIIVSKYFLADFDEDKFSKLESEFKDVGYKIKIKNIKKCPDGSYS